ncbi:hypothetical protein DFH09DRAFT_1306773 [Mycena vulgaris]|nr:hypothetical protein DFH09DRAFT_1306773 [Mycena vulgaris]
MSTTLTVPPGFGYTAAALLSTVVLLTGQSIAVARFRAAAGVERPREAPAKACPPE